MWDLFVGKKRKKNKEGRSKHSVGIRMRKTKALSSKRWEGEELTEITCPGAPRTKTEVSTRPCPQSKRGENFRGGGNFLGRNRRTFEKRGVEASKKRRRSIICGNDKEINRGGQGNAKAGKFVFFWRKKKEVKKAPWPGVDFLN